MLTNPSDLTKEQLLVRVSILENRVAFLRRALEEVARFFRKSKRLNYVKAALEFDGNHE